MNTILVSGASGVVGYGILRSLRQSGKQIKLVGTTIYLDSAAQGFCDIFEQAPLTNDAGYIDWLTGTIKKHQIALVIPGIDVDMYEWAEHISEINESGAKVLLNNRQLISLCKDKWNFYKKLHKAAIPYAIESSLDSDFDTLINKFGLPFLLKPRHGFGSKGIVIVDSLERFQKSQHDMGSILMAQPIVGSDNEEFTTSAFCDGNGSFYASMTLKRLLSKEGFTEKAEVVNIADMDEVLLTLCEYFKPVGPTNFQFRRHHGELKLLEINPRISSSTSIRTAFGYNESKMAVEYYLEDTIPEQPVIKLGRAARYMEDLIFYEDRADSRYPR